jgi:DNA-nicking Smr family endonuclease
MLGHIRDRALPAELPAESSDGRRSCVQSYLAMSEASDERPAPDGREPTDNDEAVAVPIEDYIDLHAFAPRDVASVVEEYLHQAAAAGFVEVRIVHGRGRGVQRAVVQRLLAGHPRVARFFDAPPDRGGWGAPVVALR